MKDEMAVWTPFVETLRKFPIYTLLQMQSVLDAEIAMRQAMFEVLPNEEPSDAGENNKPTMKVVK